MKLKTWARKWLWRYLCEGSKQHHNSSVRTINVSA